MSRLFITNIHINKVRHLKDIDIPVGTAEEMKHLILIGKNGSGKTSLLEALKRNLNLLAEPAGQSAEQPNGELVLTFSESENVLRDAFANGQFIQAYYGAQRVFSADQPNSIKKVELHRHYSLTEAPRQQFLSYLLDLKMTQAMSMASDKPEDAAKADEIQQWFDKIQAIVRDIYGDPDLRIEFNVETYQFIIHEKGREPFDFNSASDGFSSVLDIVIDMVLRMQQQNRQTIVFNKPGIVLIDEIENHLHLDLQKKILHYFTMLFPNVQFIITTHSPFVINSVENVVIYDVEHCRFVPQKDFSVSIG